MGRICDRYRASSPDRAANAGAISKLLIELDRDVRSVRSEVISTADVAVLDSPTTSGVEFGEVGERLGEKSDVFAVAFHAMSAPNDQTELLRRLDIIAAFLRDIQERFAAAADRADVSLLALRSLGGVVFHLRVLEREALVVAGRRKVPPWDR